MSHHIERSFCLGGHLTDLYVVYLAMACPSHGSLMTHVIHVVIKSTGAMKFGNITLFHLPFCCVQFGLRLQEQYMYNIQ